MIFLYEGVYLQTWLFAVSVWAVQESVLREEFSVKMGPQNRRYTIIKHISKIKRNKIKGTFMHTCFDSIHINYLHNKCMGLDGNLKAPCKRTQHCWPATPNNLGCHMLRPFAHPVPCCWMLFRVVAQSLKPVKLFCQQLPTFFCSVIAEA